MPTERETFDAIILKLEKREEKLKKECVEVRIAIEMLRKERDALASEPVGSLPPILGEPPKTSSVSQELREFIPQFLRDNHPKRLLKSDLVQAVEKREIGKGAKSLVALLSKTLTELVKHGSVIKEVDKNNTFYSSKPA